MAKNITVSIISPAHNEETTIESFVDNAVSFLRKHKIAGEVIIAENGSKDKTRSLLSSLREKYPELVVLLLPVGNKGQALKKAMLSARGEKLITIDTDLWSDEFAIKSLEKLDNFDVVVGSRSVAGGKDKRPFLSRLLNAGYYFPYRLVFNFQGTNTHAQLSFRKDKITPLVKQCKTGDLNFDTELIIRAERAGLTKIEIPTIVEEIRARRYSLVDQLVKTVKNFLTLFTAIGPSPNWSYLILFTAILVGLFFRFYHFADWFFFSVDEEHYAYMTRMITVDYHLPLIGGPISGTKLYMAPWFLYFNAVWFFLTNNNPLATGAIFAFLELSTIYFIYLIGKKIFSPLAGAVGALLYGSSFLMALFSRHYWNITLTPLISAISFYGLLRYLEGSRKWLIATAVVVGFGLSSTFSNFAVFLFLLLAIIFYKHRLRDILSFIGVIAAIHIPLVFFDLRHDFWTLRALWEFLSNRAGETVPVMERIMATAVQFGQTLGKALVIASPLNVSDETAICYQGISHYQPSIWTIILAVLILAWFLWRKRLWLFLILAIINIFSLVLFRADPQERHWLPFLPLFFVLAGAFFTKYRIALLFVPILIVINLYSLLGSYASYGLPNKIAVVKAIISQTQEKKFSLEVQGNCHRWGYRYLFSQFDHEPAASYLDDSFSWMYSSPPQPQNVLTKVLISAPDDGHIEIYYFKTQ